METTSELPITPRRPEDFCGCHHKAYRHKNVGDFQGNGPCTIMNCDCKGFHAIVEPDEAKIVTFTVSPKTAKILKLMFDELEHADTKYADDRMSPDEMKSSLATVKCEFEELKRETKRKKKRPDMMAKESIQLLAMSFKWNRDVIYAEDTK